MILLQDNRIAMAEALALRLPDAAIRVAPATLRARLDRRRVEGAAASTFNVVKAKRIATFNAKSRRDNLCSQQFIRNAETLHQRHGIPAQITT